MAEQTLPVAVSCGEPSGIGPELAVKARAALGTVLPFVLLGDPRHLPRGTAYREVSRAADALSVPASHLPVLPVPFAAEAPPGRPLPENAAGVIAAIERAVRDLQRLHTDLDAQLRNTGQGTPKTTDARRKVTGAKR